MICYEKKTLAVIKTKLKLIVSLNAEVYMYSFQNKIKIKLVFWRHLVQNPYFIM